MSSQEFRERGVAEELFYLAERYRGTRYGTAPFSTAEPGSADVTASFELDLEERLACFLRGRGCPDGSCQELLTLALLLRRPGLLGPGGLRPGLPGLALPALGGSLFP